MSDVTQGNQIARTPTGEIAEPGSQPQQSSNTTPSTTAPTTTTPEPTAEGDKSLINKKPEAKPTGAPEEYAAYTLPEGLELNETNVKEFNTIAKELNLPQDAAQKLVDFHVKTIQAAQEGPMQVWRDQQDAWVAEVKADPKIGGKLPEVLNTIAKAVDTLGPELAEPFRDAMNFTGAGNNPAFIRAMYVMAQKLTEGVPVAGNQPSPAGQRAPGARPPSAASALYPNLPSAEG